MTLRWNPIKVLIPVVLMASGCGGPHEQKEPAPEAMAVTSHQAVQIPWETDWETAFARAGSLGKPVMANFYADWCVWCKTLETITFRDAKVAALLADHVVPVSIDIEGPQKTRARDWNVQAPPTIVFLTADGRELGRIPGYLPPAQFVTVVEKILSGEPVNFG